MTSGFRATGRAMTAYFARNYAADYPEPESNLAACLAGFRVGEAPVIMQERQGGVSSISSFKSAYYMIKVSLSLIIDRLSIKRFTTGRNVFCGYHTTILRGDPMSDKFQAFMILGALVLLVIIFVLLKHGKMTVKYSLLWLCLSLVLLVFALFPYVVYVLRDLMGVEMPVNLVFMLMFCFVLLVLLSLSIAISQLAEKSKRLTQANAILEKRVRELEKALGTPTDNTPDH